MTEAVTAERKKSDTWVEISANSRVPKPFYYEEPSVEIIQDIKRHIRETGEPWTWHGIHIPSPRRAL